jgi:hypothetical protein
MDWRQQLASTLTSETEAYGYTLSIWGAGALLIHRYGAPSIVGVYAYIGGALLGFVVLALVAFRHLFVREEPDGEGSLVVASMVHVVATAGNLTVTHLIVIGILPRFVLPAPAAFVLVGLQVTVTYNVFLLIERALARATAHLDPNARTEE